MYKTGDIIAREYAVSCVFTNGGMGVVDKFQLRHWVDALTNKGRLGSILEKFTYRIGSTDHQYIACGSTISQDGHAGEKFDFCVMNPPFGTPRKEDLKNWGIGDKKEVKPYDDEATFYKPVELRTQDEIAADIAALEGETKGLLKEILG